MPLRRPTPHRRLTRLLTRRRLLVAGLVPLFLGVPVPLPAGAEPLRPATVSGYRLLDLGTLGGKGSWAAAVNDRGQVVGFAQTAAGRWHAFLWAGGRMRDLGTGGADQSFAVDVNARGDVLGYTASGTGGDPRVVLWSGGRMRHLGIQGHPVAFNDQGRIVGTRATTGGSGARPFSWYQGRLTDLTRYGVGAEASIGGINATGDIVGADETGAFLLRAGRVLRPPEGSGMHLAFAADINAAGTVVGSGQFAVDGSPRSRGRAMSWRPGVGVQDLGSLGGPDAAPGYSSAWAVNDRGLIVGSSTTPESPDDRACRWAGGVPFPLGDLYAPSGSSLVTDVNNHGVIVGVGPVRPLEIMVENRHALVWQPARTP